ncbi:Methyltransferase domain containing protein [Novymonas esmeraldas]|uniref:Methyltransferase domain containing protein n=1 Tax=Novymonas esmeraldas TaxID=1808958 RepID=A0AAW0F420_9TRYP
MEAQRASSPAPLDLKRIRAEGGESLASMRVPAPSDTAADAATYERQFVHDVYSAIADHFSGTRYKAWPLVSAFLGRLPPFSLVADVGCGNGKYFAAAQRLLAAAPPPPGDASCAKSDGASPHELEAQPLPPLLAAASVPAHRYVVGLDYSEELLRSTQRRLVDPNMHQPPVPRRRLHRKRAASEADGGATPVSTEELPRTDTVRSDALRCPLRGGLFDAAISIAVIHHYASRERRVAAVRELLRLVRPHGGRVLIYVWAREQAGRTKRPIDPDTGDGLVRWERHQKFDTTQQVFHRFYHFFAEGELEQLCHEAANGDGGAGAMPYVVEESYYDKENWCVVLERR